VGLAGALPCVLALASEYAPRRIRGLMVTVVFSAYPFGGAIGGLLSAWLTTVSDWRMVFYIGGILPALVAVAIAVLMPESMQFLAVRGATQRIEAVLRRLKLDADPTTAEGPAVGAPGPRAGLRSLFANGLAPATLLLWTVYFFAFATTKIMVVWFPSILKEAGLTVVMAGVAQASFNLGTTGGMAVSGRLVDRYGPGRVLTPALVACSVAVLMLGVMAHGVASVLVLAALVGAFLGIGAAGVHVVAVQLYAPPVRSTGLGFGLASSRFGQVLSPMMVGVMLTAGAGAQAVYATVAVLPLLAGVAALVLVFQLRPITARASLAADVQIANTH
jgi:AAHS family 4-hydroxybenzoate transporter-like MFS transporter